MHRSCLRRRAWVALLSLAACAGPAAVKPPVASWDDMGELPRADRLCTELGTDTRLISLPGAVLRFIEHGPKPAQEGAVLFVHGLGGALGDFAPVTEKMSASHHVVAVDLPGFGGSVSRNHDYRVTGYADVLASFIERLALLRVHLVCHSLGGQVCLALALGHGQLVRSLTLVSPAGVYRPPQYLRSAARHFGKINIGTVDIGDPSRSFAAALTYADGDLLKRFVTSDPTALTALSSFRENMRDRLALVRVPTLVIWGDADPILPMADAFVIAANVPGAVLHIVEGAGHSPQLTHPEIVHEWIEAHSRRH